MNPVEPIGVIALPDGRRRVVFGSDLAQFIIGPDRLRLFGTWLVPSEEPAWTGEHPDPELTRLALAAA